MRGKVAPDTDGNGGLADIASTLRDRLGECSPAERKVARVLLAGYPMVGLETATAIAARAGVSTPTVIRLVTRLGFAGYPHFQHAVRDELSGRTASPITLYDWTGFGSADVDTASLADASARTLAQAVGATISGLPAADVAAVVALLADPKRPVYLLGGRFTRLLAHYLALHLAQMRSGTAMLPAEAVERASVLARCGKRDVLVVLDYRRYEPPSLAAAQHVRNRGGAVVLLTDPWQSPVAAIADVVLTCKVDSASPYDSLVPSMAVIETLVAGVLAALGPAGHASMQQVETVANDLSVY